MSLPPGLLPEDDAPRRSRGPRLLLLVSLVSLSLAGYAWRAMTLEKEAGLREATAAAELARTVEVLQTEIRRKPTETPPALPPPPPALPPAAPSETRYLPPLAAEAAQERLTQGLHEFRSGRYEQAERHFFRALPDSLLYLALSGLARGDFADAFAFLSRAMVHVPGWLQKIRPRDLFGSEEAYRGVVASLEARAAADPLDAEAKLLLGYLRFHDPGPGHAKALVAEALNVKPDLSEARRFMEALGP
jgi:tetratricopeptide (TPR) repeat protein